MSEKRPRSMTQENVANAGAVLRAAVRARLRERAAQEGVSVTGDEIDDALRQMKRVQLDPRFLDSAPKGPCPDCGGSGRYVSLLWDDPCPACRGNG